MAVIDPSARVDPGAQLADDVEVGAFSVIGPDVEIAAGTRIGPHVVISGHTRIGRDNRIFQFCSVGEEPQHRGYKGELTRVEIGDGNTIREFCSIHRGTLFDEGVTRIGHHNLLMAYVHIAHDCVLGDGITMANGASLAGHVNLADHCILAGFAMVHQFTQVGTLAYLGYSTGVTRDVPAFVRCSGYTAQPHGINSVGMRRRGYTEEDVRSVKQAYRTVYRAKLLFDTAREALAPLAEANPAADIFLASLNRSKRGIIR